MPFYEFFGLNGLIKINRSFQIKPHELRYLMDVVMITINIIIFRLLLAELLWV